jgi:hypothetical protein
VPKVQGSVTAQGTGQPSSDQGSFRAGGEESFGTEREDGLHGISDIAIPGVIGNPLDELWSHFFNPAGQFVTRVSGYV